MSPATCDKCGEGLRLLRVFVSPTRVHNLASLVYACVGCKYVVTWAETMPSDLDSWLATMRMYDWIGKLNILDGPREEQEAEDCRCGVPN